MLNSPWLSALVILLAYLFGSISSAIIVCRSMGLPDPRTSGSRNPGATNVLRIGGKKAAIITLLGDSLKGLIPVLIIKLLGFDNTVVALAALAALLGHLFPIFFRFEGGKGVATAIGCLLALNWPTGLCWLATWLIVAKLFHYSSLAALVASVLAPVYLWYFGASQNEVLIVAFMSLLIIIRHKENIQNLWTGKEKKLNHRDDHKRMSSSDQRG